MGRQVALVFFGQQRDPSYHAHESGRVMTVPLLILAVGAVVGGIINLPWTHWLSDWLFPVLQEEAGEFNLVMAALATAGAVGMGYLGWSIYSRAASRVKVGGKDPAYRVTGDIWDGMEEAWYVDAAYSRAVVSPFRRLASFLARVFDPQGIDGLVMGVAGLFGWVGLGVRRLQSGYVRTYALVFTVGVLLVLGFMLVAAQ
jgi:NADH-quinone oxidoreductase subunit L